MTTEWRRRLLMIRSGYPIDRLRSTLSRTLLAALAVAAVMLVLEYGVRPWHGALWLERDAVLRGEVWRLVTAHTINLNRTHTWLNIAGIGLILGTLASILTPRRFMASILASAASISIGWMILAPPGVVYVGFSGITHGVFVWGGLMMWRIGPRWFALVILGTVAAKLGHEAVFGAVAGAEDAIEGRVSYLSHALGGLGGALLAGVGWHLKGPVAAVCIALALFQAQEERLNIGMPAILPLPEVIHWRVHE